MAEDKCIALTCAGCGVGFTSCRKKKFCSAACRASVRSPMTREEYRTHVRESAPVYTCERCEAHFRVAIGGSNRKRGLTPKFCSMECLRQHWECRRRQADDLKARQVAVKMLLCALIKAAKLKAAAESKVAVDCLHCGSAFAPSRAGNNICSLACRRKRGRALAKGSPWQVATKRAHRKAYKMRKRCASVEAFAAEKVLARDNWTCQICGVPTPARLRGTYKDNAPEVDHVLAIARGGAHSMANCQCSCRRCNLSKGAGPALGQIRLL